MIVLPVKVSAEVWVKIPFVLCGKGGEGGVTGLLGIKLGLHSRGYAREIAKLGAGDGAGNQILTRISHKRPRSSQLIKGGGSTHLESSHHMQAGTWSVRARVNANAGCRGGSIQNCTALHPLGVATGSSCPAQHAGASC